MTVGLVSLRAHGQSLVRSRGRGLGRMGDPPRPTRPTAGSRPARTTRGRGGPGRRSRDRAATSARRAERPAAQEPGRALEPHDAGHLLRPEPELAGEPFGEVPPAPAGPGRQLVHPQPSAAREQAGPRAAEGPRPRTPARRGRAARRRSRTSSRTAKRADQPGADASRSASVVGVGTDHVRQLDHEAAEFAGRDAQQRAGSQRRQVELDAVLVAVVLDVHGARGESAGEAPELAGHLRRRPACGSAGWADRAR